MVGIFFVWCLNCKTIYYTWYTWSGWTQFMVGDSIWILDWRVVFFFVDEAIQTKVKGGHGDKVTVFVPYTSEDTFLCRLYDNTGVITLAPKGTLCCIYGTILVICKESSETNKMCTVKVLNFQIPKMFGVITLKFKQKSFFH